MKVIVCVGATAGRAVIYGTVAEEPQVGQPIRVQDARMVLRFGDNGLFGLAATGPTSPTRLTHAVDVTVASKVFEWLSVSDEAAQKIDALPPFEGS